jgi:hypothetical protein
MTFMQLYAVSRRIFCLAIALAALSLPLSAVQYTANISANLNNLASGVSGTNAFMRFRLQNCGTFNPEIPGVSVVLAFQQDFRANSAGAVTGTIYGNDQITCGGLHSTVYEVSYYVNQIMVGVPKLYYICTEFPGGGCSNSSLTFDPTLATEIDPGPPPAISPFGYIYSQNLGSQTILQPPSSSLTIAGLLNVSELTPDRARCNSRSISLSEHGPTSQMLPLLAIARWVAAP